MHNKHLHIDFRPYKVHLIFAWLFRTYFHIVKNDKGPNYGIAFVLKFWLCEISFCRDSHTVLLNKSTELQVWYHVKTKTLLVCVQHFIQRRVLMSGQMYVIAVEATVATAVTSVCWTNKPRNIIHCEAINKEAHPFQTYSAEGYLCYGTDFRKTAFIFF